MLHVCILHIFAARTIQIKTNTWTAVVCFGAPLWFVKCLTDDFFLYLPRIFLFNRTHLLDGGVDKSVIDHHWKRKESRDDLLFELWPSRIRMHIYQPHLIICTFMHSILRWIVKHINKKHVSVSWTLGLHNYSRHYLFLGTRQSTSLVPYVISNWMLTNL